MSENNPPKNLARFGTTKRGKPMLIDHQSFRYTMDNEKNGRTFWRCIDKEAKRCKGRAATFQGEVVYLSENHSHGSDIVKTSVKLKEQAAIAKAVENPLVPPRRILADLASSFTDFREMAAKTPNENLARQISYQRKMSREHPPAPKDWKDLEAIPEDLARTSQQKRFLLLNSVKDNQPGTLIFSSDWQLSLLDSADSLTADGTFDTCPFPFGQIYTVVANFHKSRRNYPVALCLLANKSTQSYEEVWSCLSGYCLENVDSVRVDYENSDIVAIRSVLPETTIEGCWFHFRSALWRNLSCRFHLAPLYNSNISFQNYIKSLASLAYVPVPKVCSFFEELQDFGKTFSAGLPSELELFDQYFEATYIGVRWGSQGKRRSPKYPLEIWNQYERAIQKTDRTTNSVESWNSAWAGSLEQKADVWTVIQAFRREEALVRSKHMDHTQRDAGPQTQRQMRRSDRDERIANLCAGIEEMEPLDYLSAMGELIELS